MSLSHPTAIARAPIQFTRHALLVCAILVSLFGVNCAEDPSTQLVVLMDTDYQVPSEVDRVRARVAKVLQTDTGTEEVQTWVHVFALSAAEPAAPKTHVLPATFAVLPSASDIDREIVLELEALPRGSDQALVKRRVRTGFIREEARLLRMLIHRACENILCGDGETCGCPNATSCATPSCVDERVPPEALERVTDPSLLPPNSQFPTVRDPDGGVPNDGGVPPLDGGGGGDGGTDCEPPLTPCGTDCVNLRSDPRFCGDCETACPLGEVCEQGACLDPGDCRTNGRGCPGFTYCDELTGDCLRGCDNDTQCTNENEACDTAEHDCVCEAGFHSCGAVCLSDSDVESCGDSCTPCPSPPGSTPTCEAGVCGLICDDGREQCGLECVDTRVDPRFCGSCVTPCPSAPSSTATCQLGVCDFICNDGFERCDDACCPTSCPEGQVLFDGACAAFHVRTANSQGNVGEHASLALDAAGLPHVAYYAQNGRNLLYSALSSSGLWSHETVSALGDVGQHASLAFDQSAVPHVAAYDADTKGLRFMTRLGLAAWSLEVVDDLGDVGQYASLTFDPQGRAHVAYYDEGNKDLRLAVAQPGGGWSTGIVDSQGDVGRFASLAIDAGGTAHIAYYDDSNKDLLLAVAQASGGWSVEIVDSQGAVGRFASLAIDATGTLYVAYYDDDNGDLKLATRRSDTGWKLEAVDSPGNVGSHGSLAIDALGMVHISYFDETNADLRHAVREEGQPWRFQTLDSLGDVGRFSSLAVDSEGHAHIVYYDATNADLKYAIVAAP